MLPAYLCAAALRPGNAPTQAGALTLLRRIIGRLRQRLPKARILVRLDGGSADAGLFAVLANQLRLLLAAAAYVQELRLPASFPYREGWRTLALRLGASTG